MFSWRFMNALCLQDFLLTAIFIDKIWVSVFLFCIKKLLISFEN
jgi:hypothetical protein